MTPYSFPFHHFASATVAWLTLAALATQAQPPMSVIDTSPAFVARPSDQTIQGPFSNFGQTFVATPGTLALNSFTFYIQYDPAVTTFGFTLYAWDGLGSLGTPLFTGSTTSAPFIEPPRPGVLTEFRSVTADTGTLPLTPGTSYFATLSGNNIGSFIIGCATRSTDLYPGGTLYLYGPDPFWPQGRDAAFTGRFVGGIDQIYPVPEPTPLQLAMVLVPLACLIYQAKSRMGSPLKENFLISSASSNTPAGEGLSRIRRKAPAGSRRLA